MKSTCSINRLCLHWFGRGIDNEKFGIQCESINKTKQKNKTKNNQTKRVSYLQWSPQRSFTINWVTLDKTRIFVILVHIFATLMTTLAHGNFNVVYKTSCYFLINFINDHRSVLLQLWEVKIMVHLHKRRHVWKLQNVEKLQAFMWVYFFFFFFDSRCVGPGTS